MADKTFLHEAGRQITFASFEKDIQKTVERLKERSASRCAVLIEAANSSHTFVRFLACLRAGYIVHLTPSYQFRDEEFREFLKTETNLTFSFWGMDQTLPESSESGSPLERSDLPSDRGLFIVRTSGTSGRKYKFVLHDPEMFFEKYRRIGPHFRKTFAFSPADSIAGIETVLEAFTHKAELIVAGDRLSPATVAALLAQHQVDYFQTTPTFLNLFVMSGEPDRHDLSALQKIAYGSEPAQRSVLEALRKRWPNIQYMHTYGMSEIGIQKTSTPQEDPSLLSLDQAFNPGRIVDGKLEVKSLTPMLRYLNVETSSYFHEGWFRTGDIVKPEGESWRIVGREGELINLAGRKFFPSEVEAALLQMPEILDATIVREANELIGSILIAKLVVSPELDRDSFMKLFKSYCERCVPFYMHPHRTIVTHEAEATSRFKKKRS